MTYEIEAATIAIMEVTVRRMRKEDAQAFLEVHHAAVRGLAAKDYDQSIIEEWAPLPITERSIASFLANPDNEIRLVAEMGGEIVGIGALVKAKNELRACYVAPKAARRGVGQALVHELEFIARKLGLTFLQADSSMTAEPFYVSLGYKTRERRDHVLGSGQRMPCVKIEKHLVPMLEPIERATR